MKANIETRDPARLAQNFGELNAMMDQLANALHKQERLSFERGKKITTRDPEWKRGHGRSAGRN